MKLTQVFFWALPIGCGFWYKNGWWVKTDEEEACLVSEKRRFIFEIHYGCVIHQKLGAALRLQQEAYRDDGPLPTDDDYIEKLFGVPLETVRSEPAGSESSDI